jgi:hypothetical protein
MYKQATTKEQPMVKKIEKEERKFCNVALLPEDHDKLKRLADDEQRTMTRQLLSQNLGSDVDLIAQCFDDLLIDECLRISDRCMSRYSFVRSGVRGPLIGCVSPD